MQLFLPSMLVLLIGILIVVLVIPQFSPLIIVIISALLLAAGTYHHFVTFMNEYKQSTWQQSLTLFAPGIILAAIILYLFVAIASFFSGGSVPIPSMPAMELPPASTATNPVTAALNSTMSAVNSVAKSVGNAANSAINAVMPNGSRNNNNNNSRKNNSGGPTRSFLATV